MHTSFLSIEFGLSLGFLMERVYEKYAWVVFLALGLLWVVVGFTQAFFTDGLAENDVQLVTDMS